MRPQQLAESDEELANPEAQEQDEYRVRRARRECTCDLLAPFGHVSCEVCNGWTPEEKSEIMDTELALEYWG